jgi:hypothetical protein
VSIDAPDFDVTDEVRILALQGDWDLERKVGPGGGKYVIAEPERAHQACMRFLKHVGDSDAQIAMVPELTIPIGTVPAIIEAINGLPKSLVFLGGIEGIGQQQYKTLLDGVNGQWQAFSKDETGDYVNSLLMIVKTATKFVVQLRAKRVSSRPENVHGLPMAKGAGPFVTIRLGMKPVTIVPLICSEFVWPEELWGHLEKEVHNNIDLVPVLQRNNDIDSRHTGPQLHRAYTSGGGTKDTRFIFANQARDESCDGTCYVVVPPTTPSAPAFDHSRNELWDLPAPATFKGFRIPDLTGCIWSARITLEHAPASALANPVCEGMVREVLTPAAAPYRGVILGLMRTAAVVVGEQLRRNHTPSAVRAAVLSVLDRQKPTYVLSSLNTDSANDVYFRLQCAEPVTWHTVEPVIRELVEAAALLGSGGDSVSLTPCEGGNCRLAERPVLVLYAPNVDEALEKRFSQAMGFEGAPIPTAIVLLGVVSSAVAVDAKRVGDVLRADRVTSASDDLADSPKKVEDSSASIRIDEIEFRSMQQLRSNLKLATLAAARARLQELFPKAYA